MRIKDKVKPKVPPVEPGVYMAVCVGVIDLGEQYSEKFKNYANKLRIVWELCGQTVEIDGEQKPRQLSKEFTFSANKKSNLRAFLTSWNGKVYSDEEFVELDIFDQLGKACQLQVVFCQVYVRCAFKIEEKHYCISSLDSFSKSTIWVLPRTGIRLGYSAVAFLYILIRKFSSASSMSSNAF